MIRYAVSALNASGDPFYTWYCSHDLVNSVKYHASQQYPGSVLDVLEVLQDDTPKS